jgi:uncharacterized protein (DUF2267 family)
MSYDEFLRRGEERTGIREPAEAERTAVVVLQALCDRLTGDEAFDLLAQLPAQLKKAVIVTRGQVPMSRDEFVGRVADELDAPVEEAQRRIRAVFGTIREAVSRGEFRDVLEQLDPEYADLLA